MVRVTNAAADLLAEIVLHENDSNYWQKRFSGLSKRDDVILRGCFNELKEKNLINTRWGDNYPYRIEILRDGYLYEEHLREADTEAKQGTEVKGNQFEYDVFLSHANTDKPAIVDSLYLSLNVLGVKIFYDKESIEWGDNWKQKILDGTKQAEFAIIVISENFFGREWTERELNEFLNRQNRDGQKLILPILHNISSELLKNHYPSVADIQAIDSAKYSCDQIALLFAGQLIKRLKSK